MDDASLQQTDTVALEQSSGDGLHGTVARTNDAGVVVEIAASVAVVVTSFAIPI